MTNSAGLSGQLYEYSKEILEFIENEEGLNPVQTEVPRRRANIDYSPTSRSISYRTETVERPVWQPQSMMTIQNRVSEFESHQQLIQLLEARGEYSGTHVLRSYVQALLQKYLDGLSDEDIVDLISTFIAQLDNGPITWRPLIYLRGLTLDVDSVLLDTEVTIRRPKPRDFEEEADMPFDYSWSPLPHNPPFSKDLLHNSPGAVMEFEMRSPSESDVTSIINQHITLLRLFKVASVVDIRREYNPEVVISTFGRPSSQPVAPYPGFNYTLDEADVGDLKSFVSTLSEPVLQRLLEESEATPLVIAYDRYGNALDDREGRLERQLTSAIMCLEALLLKEQEWGELSERLSRRSGILLHQFGFQPNEVSRKMREAYKIRSQYVHGSKLDQEGDIDSLTRDVMEYARRCLVIFLQLSDENGKSDLLSKIDNASLHPNAREALDELISEECNI